jgi:hypothetical protein
MNCKIGTGSAVRLGGVFLVLLSFTVGGVSEAATSKSVSDTTQFIKLMKRGVNSAYVATYEVSNYDFFSWGLITVANLPPRPGTKVPANANDYSSDLETSYVFRAKDGRIVQWIQDHTRVSSCSNGASPSGNETLQCSRPFQYVPSNGFAEESVGFVPETVLQHFESFDPEFKGQSSLVFSKSSKQFGALQCIRQAQVGVKDPERETTCLNRSGLLVSWTSVNPGATVRVSLTHLSTHPTKTNFVTLKRPTKAMILPPF